MEYEDSATSPSIEHRASAVGHLLLITHYLLLIFLCGCTNPDKYHDKADRQVYEILKKKRKALLNRDNDFTIDRPAVTLRDKILGKDKKLENRTKGAAIPEEERFATPGDGLQPAGVQQVVDPIILSLPRALEIAAENGREYQEEKEQVYLSALSLTLEEHAFSNRFAGLILGGFTQTDEANRSGDVETQGILNRRFASGSRLAASLGLKAVKILSGNVDSSILTELDLEYVKPLLRGAGRKVVMEGLLQAERDVVYAVQLFARFEKEFAVQIVRDFYNVLEQQTIMDNELLNYQTLTKSREEAEAKEEAQRLPNIQLDQTRQNELRARSRWIAATERYQGALDRFRIVLGLPTDAPVELDRREIEALREVEPPQVDFDPAAAIKEALESRLDYFVAIARIEDSERKIEVAKNGLLPDLDLTVTSSVESRRPNHLGDLRIKNGRYTAGASIGLPFDRLGERNAFRQAEINLERTKRLRDEIEDIVKLQVRNAHRALIQTSESFQIQKQSEVLAMRRVKGANLLLQSGRAQARDLLEAQDALINAQNALIGALVDYRVARLEYLRDTGSLDVDVALKLPAN
ncbi:MAG: TolC family protein [Planctomycetota bacterium]|nr:TolC family protein [Planctomycetota bacterium]